MNNEVKWDGHSAQEYIRGPKEPSLRGSIRTFLVMLPARNKKPYDPPNSTPLIGISVAKPFAARPDIPLLVKKSLTVNKKDPVPYHPRANTNVKIPSQRGTVTLQQQVCPDWNMQMDLRPSHTSPTDHSRCCEDKIKVDIQRKYPESNNT
ncbi:hypothetical protein Tco_1229672 [Tanacetum coccineum]